jgi:hypothetical protein
MATQLELARWARRAKPGSVFVYARRAVPRLWEDGKKDADEDVFRFARRLSDHREVFLSQRRERGGMVAYTATAVNPFLMVRLHNALRRWNQNRPNVFRKNAA